MIQLIFMRHGKSDHNGSDNDYWYSSNPLHPNYRVSNLTSEGRFTVCKSGQELYRLGLHPEESLVFVSPMPRTQQTAEILAEQGVIGRSWINDWQITEMQAGDLESKYGALDDEGIPLTKEAKKERKLAGGYESNESLASRTNAFAQSVLAMIQKQPVKNILVISHDETLEALIHAFGIQDPQEGKIPHGKYRAFSIPIY